MAAQRETTLETVITRLIPGLRTSFEFNHPGGAAVCMCMPQMPELPPLLPGQRVCITGRWSTALQGFFTASQVVLVPLAAG